MIGLSVSFLGDKVIIVVQDPIKINDENEPEPDISILKSRKITTLWNIPIP
ncbi:MAG: hypothetical protein AAF600_19970 [Bacteroidota bacterium]